MSLWKVRCDKKYFPFWLDFNGIFVDQIANNFINENLLSIINSIKGPCKDFERTGTKKLKILRSWNSKYFLLGNIIFWNSSKCSCATTPMTLVLTQALIQSIYLHCVANQISLPQKVPLKKCLLEAATSKVLHNLQWHYKNLQNNEQGCSAFPVLKIMTQFCYCLALPHIEI